jgi:activator of 2-hydroxyglutaryl-CoA dehydratase
MFLTGSGSGPLCAPTGGKFVQEVNAVTLAVEHLHPDVGSVIELGGQDAKIIMFKKDEKTGEKTATASMNDKCASGTGATIDKCFLKVNAPAGDGHEPPLRRLEAAPRRRQVRRLRRDRHRQPDQERHPVEGGPLLARRRDRPPEPQRAHARRHAQAPVLLLGGPNTYLPFLQECWRLRIPQTWDERGYDYPKDVPIEETHLRPENAQYYAALGAVLYGLHEEARRRRARRGSTAARVHHDGRKARLGESAGPPLAKTETSSTSSSELYKHPEVRARARSSEGRSCARSSGSTAARRRRKAVLVDYDDGKILCKAYQLSKGNPIQDTKELLAQLRALRRGDRRRSSRSWASARPATRPTCSKSACAPT